MEIKIKVGGMSCEHCVARVKKAISEIEGVKSWDVDLKSGIATIDIDDEALVSKVKDAIKSAGYRVE